MNKMIIKSKVSKYIFIYFGNNIKILMKFRLEK